MAKRRPFKPGFYGWTKEDFKIISWCINNSIACCVIPAKKAETKKEDAPKKATASDDLSSKTVAELKEMAKAKGIEGISSMKKADLIAALS